MDPDAPAFIPRFGAPAPAEAPNERVEPEGEAESWEDSAAGADSSEPPVSADQVNGDIGIVDDAAEEVKKVSIDEPSAKPAPEPAVAPPEDEEEIIGEEQEGEIIANFEGAGDGKRHVNIVFIGHVDAGKSTISGHILYLTGGVDERTMEKFEREAKARNRESWKYAWALDTTEQERNKGKTEECGRATFVTESKKFTILDAPGHKNFVPHMIGGASQADVALLVISARKGEFETGFERGGQTREHAMLAKTSGVRSLIVLINKMDDPTILLPDGKWSKQRYDECREKLLPYLKQVGWRPSDLTWLPISGISGENLKLKVTPEVCPWFKGEPLLDTLENLKPPERLIKAPVRFPIFEKYKEMGTVVMGKLESGVITVNQRLMVMPSKGPIMIEAIQLETGDSLTRAEPGDNLRLRLKGIEEEDVRIGSVICSEDHAIPGSNRFDVRLMILEHKSIITAGYSAVMHVNAAVVECSIEKLLAVLDKKTGEIATKNPRFAKPGMTVIARISTAQGVCIEPFKEFAQLGRFMIRDEGATIGVGVVLKIRDTP
uniref:Tr-type G domain-containing protein n=1 Tax=Rhodosorus marinus TaxID=101924 RepID=A0A7S3EKJ1_9RHOD